MMFLSLEKPLFPIQYVLTVHFDFVFNNNLIQYIQSPTHSKGNILDLILTNSSEIIQEVCVLSNEPFPQMRSDHRMISFQIPCL